MTKMHKMDKINWISKMNMTEALEVLNDLTKFGINLGLERIRALLEQFDNPQNHLQIIHIAGTNGKGSTAAVLSAVLKKAGYHVGVFTSPHLISYTERIAINGDPIAENEFALLLSEIVSECQKVKNVTGENPTEFEVLTAMAFIYFYRKKVDFVILEVGMGGDIDSTNIIKKPLLSIITNVTIDHTDYLGRSITEIAKKKSGIIKEDCPVITASEDPTVLEVLRTKAHEKNAVLYELYNEFSWELTEETIKGQSINVKSSRNDYGRIYIPLLGKHQLINTATGLLALEVLKLQGFAVGMKSIAEGLLEVEWPGRLEVLKKEPLIIVDGAHNPAGMEALSDWLKIQRPNYEKIILVIGMLADKDRVEAVKFIDGLIDKVIITRPPSARAGHWEDLSDCFIKANEDKTIEESPFAAFDLAVDNAGPKDMVIITGSLYLIGDARRYFV